MNSIPRWDCIIRHPKPQKGDEFKVVVSTHFLLRDLLDGIERAPRFVTMLLWRGQLGQTRRDPCRLKPPKVLEG